MFPFVRAWHIPSSEISGISFSQKFIHSKTWDTITRNIYGIYLSENKDIGSPLHLKMYESALCKRFKNQYLLALLKHKTFK